MLTYDKAVLVADDAARKQLTDALIDWSQHDFDHRLTNSTQMFGYEQMMRAIGAPAVKPLPALITQRFDEFRSHRVAGIAELGDQPTKEATAAKLVDLAKYTGSQPWIDKTKPLVEEANKASKINPTPAQFRHSSRSTKKKRSTGSSPPSRRSGRVQRSTTVSRSQSTRRRPRNAGRRHWRLSRGDSTATTPRTSTRR